MPGKKTPNVTRSVQNGPVLDSIFAILSFIQAYRQTKTFSMGRYSEMSTSCQISGLLVGRGKKSQISRESSRPVSLKNDWQRTADFVRASRANFVGNRLVLR